MNIKVEERSRLAARLVDDEIIECVVLDGRSELNELDVYNDLRVV